MEKPEIILKAGMNAALEGAFKKTWKENQHRFPKGTSQKFVEDLIEDNLHTLADMFFASVLWKVNHEKKQSAPKGEGH